MINWFNMPDEGLSNGGLFEVKELEVTENGTYEENGEMYNKVTVNVEGGGGSSDFSTAEVTFENVDTSSPYVVSVSAIKDDMIKKDGGDVLSPITVTVPLYKGKNILPLNCISDNDPTYMPTTEGSIELSMESMGFIVTGNGTIIAQGDSK